MRAMWSGNLGFGLVSVPVKMYSGADDKAFSLNQLHEDCGTRIKMPKYCPNCKKFLESGEIIKGYPVSKEQYIPLTDGELETLPLGSVHSIKLEGFIKNWGEFDPRWIKDTYLLAPDEGEIAARAYVLFLKAMEELGVTGIAKIAIRQREHLCAVRVSSGIMMLQTLHWGAEIRDFGEIMVSASVTEKEMEMAKTLIGMTDGLDLYAFRDEYQDALGKLIAAKMAGETLVSTALPTPKEGVDLAEQLLASIKAMEKVES